MAEELFHGGVCGGGNWYWNTSRNLYGSSPCSLSTVVIQDVLKPHETLHMMGNSLSSSTNPDDIWNQDFLHDDSGRSEENYSNNILQENYNWQENDWINSTINFSQLDSSVIINSFKQANQTSECAATTCQELSSGSSFPLDTVSYGYNNSSLLEALFDDTDSQETPQQSLSNDHQTFNYSVNSNQFLPSFAKQQPLSTKVRANFLPTSQSQVLPSSLHCKRPNLPSFSAKHQNEEAMDLASAAAKKASYEPALIKRPRIETPSPLPTFKVRKEKLGDRITALQQLVSPFGKTDTASVLHEAIEYIKYLHDQVNELSSPYSKHRSAPRRRLQAGQDGEGVMQQDLKSRGLCLVPVSSTFPVAQTPTDFWTPTFRGSFK